MSEGKDQQIIIKKYKKGGEEGHGGTWKVAYADFVTAMMAFFLLLWLLTMTSQQKKIALSHYFQNYSIFEKGGGSVVATIEDTPGEGLFDVGKGKEVAPPKTVMASELSQKIKRHMDQNLQRYRDRVFIVEDDGNLRIEIVDTVGTSFFTAGGVDLNEDGKALLKGLVPVFKGLDRKLIIEGHTDTTGSREKNWDISTQRALSARFELERDGIPPDQIEMVAGYASTRPFIKSNPADPKNRRVSIVVDYKTPRYQPSPGQIMQKPPLPDSPLGLGS
ncbi:MAG TPA: flagellar motor protein MotB [Deltaproteobacteria bacterium]|nr:flagellar motor protein MotB [Deltaproteobacteria bacterium]